MALMNMHANLLINLIILLKIHLSSQGHFYDDFNMFPPLVMHRAIEYHFCSPFGKLRPKWGLQVGEGVAHLQMGSKRRRKRNEAGRGRRIQGVGRDRR